MSDASRSPARLPAGSTRTVALFPLPLTVLFPLVTHPFYVFEPRYRAMLAHVLDHDGHVGVPLLLPGFERIYHGSPPIAGVFGVGVVTAYETHDDGTSHIEVGGVARVRLMHEVPHPAFRLAEVCVLPDAAGSTPTETLLAALRQAVTRLQALAVPTPVRDALAAALAPCGVDAEHTINALSTLAVPDAMHRQRLLETDNLSERAELLISLMARLRPRSGGP